MRRALLAVAACVAIFIGAIAVRDWRRGYRSTDGATLVHLTLHSHAVGHDLHEILVRPPKRGSRVLLVLLHGRSSSPSSFLNQPFFDALAALGKRAPTVLLLDGGDHSYWHDRADGKWGTMVLREAIPAAVRRTGATRVAIGGISMGGFGALALGARGSFCAVGSRSAALWFRAGDSAPGAFDDAEDFARNGDLRHAGVDGRRRKRSVPRRRRRVRARDPCAAARLAGRPRRVVLASARPPIPEVLCGQLRVTRG